MADTKLTALSEISVPALEDLMYWIDDPSGTPISNKATLARALGLVPGVPQARLTLESGVPVSTTDQTAKSTLYYNTCIPIGLYTGGIGFVTTYDGTRRKRQQLGDVSLSPSLTSGKLYDVFLKNSDLSLVLSAAWTNNTTRADTIVNVAGLPVANADNTYLWLGTIRASATDQMSDSCGFAGTTQVGAQRFVWNAYNGVLRPMTVIDTTNSWTYNSTTPQQANAAAGNKVEYIVGMAGVYVESIQVVTANSQGGVSSSNVGIGLNATNAFSGLFGQQNAGTTAGTNIIVMPAVRRLSSALGYSYLAWLEAASAGTATFYGDNNGTLVQSGLIASLVG